MANDDGKNENDERLFITFLVCFFASRARLFPPFQLRVQSTQKCERKKQQKLLEKKKWHSNRNRFKRLILFSINDLILLFVSICRTPVHCGKISRPKRINCMSAWGKWIRCCFFFLRDAMKPFRLPIIVRWTFFFYGNEKRRQKLHCAIGRKCVNL